MHSKRTTPKPCEVLIAPSADFVRLSSFLLCPRLVTFWSNSHKYLNPKSKWPPVCKVWHLSKKYCVQKRKNSVHICSKLNSKLSRCLSNNIVFLGCKSLQICCLSNFAEWTGLNTKLDKMKYRNDFGYVWFHWGKVFSIYEIKENRAGFLYAML